MAKITLLAECTISAFSIVRIELVEADQSPAAVIVRWPSKPSVVTTRRFPETAAALTRAFAAASTELAHIKANRKL